MSSHYIGPDNILRIMLWGSPQVMEVIMSSINEIEI